jgi:hypothetical protein
MYPGIPNFRYDIVVLGSGTEQALSAASQCANAGLGTLLVEEHLGACSELHGKLTCRTGRCFVMGVGKLALLDSMTGDETAFVETKALIVEAGPDDGEAFLGLRKLGVAFSSDGAIADRTGRTNIPGIYVIRSDDHNADDKIAESMAVVRRAVEFCNGATQ